MKIKGITAPPAAGPAKLTPHAAADARTTESHETGPKNMLLGLYESPKEGLRFEDKKVHFDGKVFLRVFQEDECLKHDVTAPKIENAFRGFTGHSTSEQQPDVREDHGDGWTDVYRAFGAIVSTSYNGSTLYLEETRLPYAALFGSPWRFENWKRVAAGLRSMREPHFTTCSDTYRLVALGDYAEAISDVFQNERPLTEAEATEAWRLFADFEKQIPNVVEELKRMSEHARRDLLDAKLRS
jgi:hypothetical protein